MGWNQGQSGNPRGFKKSTRRRDFERRVREECTESALVALKAGIEAREPWAVTLALAYGYGKPTEHVEVDEPADESIEKMPTADLLRLVTNAPH